MNLRNPMCTGIKPQTYIKESNVYNKYPDCLSNRKFERLDDPLDETVTISVHKYSVIMRRDDITWFERHIAKTLATLFS